MTLYGLFDQARKEVELLCKQRNNHSLNLQEVEDLDTQCDIIINRKSILLTSEEDIINNFVISASSYSVLRKYFKVNSLHNIRNFDSFFGTSFFNQDIPKLTFKQWNTIVTTWGGKVFNSNFFSLNELNDFMKEEYNKGNKSLNRKPIPRIIWTLASGLPIVKKHILNNPIQFIKHYDNISRKHPGKAYKLARLFAENKYEKQKIVGMGAPLVCDFFKNIGLSYFVKIDVHMKDIIGNLSLEKLNDKEIFILSWLISREVDIEPFYLDKIIFIGRKFSKERFKSIFTKYKAEYKQDIDKLINQIPEYK